MLFATYTVSGQVAIEKDAVTNTSVILEFNDQHSSNTGGKAKSLILPIVTSETALAKSEGVIFFDANDQKVKYMKSATEAIAMSDAGTANIAAPINADKAVDGVLITDGTVTTTDKAVLRLESNSKAMILPRVNDVEAMYNPAAGSMVYDLKSNSIAVFNGSVWSFWN